METRLKILIGFAALLAAVVVVVAIGGGDDEDDGGSSDEAATELDVEVLEEGTGPEAKEGDTLQIRYTGTLLADGTEFDSNADGDAPALPVTLGQGGVIPGFEQGLEGAKQGEKRKITIPSDLGYGAQGSPPAIPPDADLVFEIEVESLEPAK